IMYRSGAAGASGRGARANTMTLRTIAASLLPILISLSLDRQALAADSQAELRERLRRLEENQAKLYELLKAKDARLDELEAEVRRQQTPPGAGPEQPAAASAQPPAAPSAST